MCSHETVAFGVIHKVPLFNFLASKHQETEEDLGDTGCKRMLYSVTK